MIRATLAILAGIMSTAGWAASAGVPAGAQSAGQMTAAARAFIATLDEKQKSVALYALEDDERPSWSNLPVLFVEPDGLHVSAMNDEQRRALHGLLRASLSSQGYAKVAGIMRLDDLLYDIEVGELEADEDRRNDAFARAFVKTRSSGNYIVAVYGTPGSGDWGWKIAGHHLGANFTVSGDRVAFTPTFLGSNPIEVHRGPYAGWTALPHEGDRGIELVRSLSDEQRDKATVDDEVADDVFEGPGRRASLSKYEGLPSAELTPPQMNLLRVLVAEYVRNSDFDAAAMQLELIERDGWDKLWFSWRGPVDPDGRFYYRVHGPRILIEYNRQDPNHDHSIVRDPRNDYGEDWLELHYEEHHPSIQEAIEAGRRRAASE